MLILKLGKSGLGVFSSLIGKVAVFLLVARLVGPLDFGIFSLGYACCSLIGIAFDFGYQSRLLKENHELLKRFGAFPSRVFYFKALLLLFLSIVALISFLALSIPLELFIPMWLGVVFTSFGNMLSASLKSVGKHGTDSINILTANLLGLAFVLFLNVTDVSDIYYFSLSFLIIGLCYLTLTVILWRKNFSVVWEKFEFEAMISECICGAPFALDAFIQRGFVFLDILILSFFVSTVNLGLYQAGQKLAQSLMPFALPFNNVVLPKLSKTNGYSSKWLEMALSLKFVMVFLGLTFWGGVTYFQDIIIDVLYGKEYAELKDSLWMFGLLIFLRYVSASFAVLLTSLGAQKSRALSNLIALITFLLYAPPLAFFYGYKGMLMALIINGIVVLIGFIISILVNYRSSYEKN